MEVAAAAISSDIEYFARFNRLPTEVSLPLSRARSRAYSTKRGTLVFELAPSSVKILNSESKSVAALAAAVACVLFRYSNESFICVGTVAPASSNPDELPLLLDVDPHMQLESLTAVASAALKEAVSHANLSLPTLLAQLGLAHITNRNPLYSVLVRDAKTQHAVSESRCDLSLTWDGDHTIEADYSARLLHTDTVRGFCGHVARVLEAIESNPQITVAEVEYLRKEERTDIIGMSRGRLVDLPCQTVLELFALQSAVAGDAPAVYFPDGDDRHLTYSELDLISEMYAAALQGRGVRPGDHIGLCLRIGVEQIIWLLAIMKCGGVVVPIDITFPSFRIATIIHDSSLVDVVAELSLVSMLPSGTRTFLVDQFAPDSKASFQPPHLDGSDPVYLLYTSGSTGRPKGVLMPHSALTNLVCWQNSQTAAAGKRTLHRTSITFDVSFQEIFSTLCFGGELVVADEAQRGDISQWPMIFRQRRINRVFLPVIALHQFAEFAGEALSDLEHLIVAGEALRITPAVMRLFKVLNAKLMNHYGPTESHVVTSYTLPDGSGGWPPLPPIGRAIQNTNVLILDTFGAPVPKGVVGEIWIGGLPLAIGYQGQESLTTDRFKPLELVEFSRQRAYRTGDFGRFTPEGEIEFAGRRDEQVKLRGYRIEFAELESTLTSIPGVKQAAAALWTDERGESRLAAYVVCETDVHPSEADIRQVLKERLPDYMVPAISGLLRIDALPLTATGKVDRSRLPNIVLRNDVAKSISGVGDTFETAADTVNAIWSRQFRTSLVDPLVSFLDLGGHSLMAIQIISEVNERLGLAVPLAELLRGPTMEHFISVVERHTLIKASTFDNTTEVADSNEASPVLLPNGIEVFATYPPEAHYLYADIFQHRTYDHHSIHYGQNSCIVDAGANIGLFTLYALDRSHSGKVVAIEPAPQLWTQLRRNVAQYGDRVTAVNVALGNRDYNAEFTYYPATPGMSTLHPDVQEEGALLKTILDNLKANSAKQTEDLSGTGQYYLDQRLIAETFRTRVRRLSRVCSELGIDNIDLLKIDVQKAELEVLEGIEAEDWPRVHQLVIEVHDIGGRLQQVTALLRSRGYVVAIGEQAPIHINSVIRFIYATRH